MRLSISKLTVLIFIIIFYTACPAPCKISDDEVLAVYRAAEPLAAALENYRKERRDYPRRLDELVPQYAKNIPEKLGARKFSYARKSADDYEFRIASATGGFYSESCNFSEIESKRENLTELK